ncbi:unnamed protein product [Lymnaea stagnalis]|uniref:Complex I-MNLL n=1 Tax=Lymnaea stagnalis TaxID=6523 RepID=A0AAV2H504_LYMST
MSLRRFRAEHYKQLALALIPLSAMMFGAYQQFLYDQSYAMYRNKSKMFGGKTVEPGKEIWY